MVRVYREQSMPRHEMQLERSGNIYTIYARGVAGSKTGVPLGYITDDLEYIDGRLHNRGFKARPLQHSWAQARCGFKYFNDACQYIAKVHPYGPMELFWKETPAGTPVTCPLCGGEGYVSAETAANYGRHHGDTTCPSCDGKGNVPYRAPERRPIHNPLPSDRVCVCGGRERARTLYCLACCRSMDCAENVKLNGRKVERR